MIYETVTGIRDATLDGSWGRAFTVEIFEEHRGNHADRGDLARLRDAVDAVRDRVEPLTMVVAAHYSLIQAAGPEAFYETIEDIGATLRREWPKAPVLFRLDYTARSRATRRGSGTSRLRAANAATCNSPRQRNAERRERPTGTP